MERFIGTPTEVGGIPLWEFLGGVKFSPPIPPARRVRIHLDSLNPGPKAKLVLPSDELHIIRSGEEVSIVPDISRNAAARRSDRIHCRRGCTSNDHGARRFARTERNVRRKSRIQGR